MAALVWAQCLGRRRYPVPEPQCYWCNAGPYVRSGGDAATVAHGVLNGEFDSQQTHAVRKMLPFQNLWAISPLLNKVEEQMK